MGTWYLVGLWWGWGPRTSGSSLLAPRWGSSPLLGIEVPVSLTSPRLLNDNLLEGLFREKARAGPSALNRTVWLPLGTHRAVWWFSGWGPFPFFWWQLPQVIVMLVSVPHAQCPECPSRVTSGCSAPGCAEAGFPELGPRAPRGMCGLLR